MMTRSNKIADNKNAITRSNCTDRAAEEKQSRIELQKSRKIGRNHQSLITNHEIENENEEKKENEEPSSKKKNGKQTELKSGT
ncbi:hypothetical protein PIB30_082886, partial [Stylosanthes scabra]|nr:hypothetical protein [Stylosanthes scabra]